MIPHPPSLVGGVAGIFSTGFQSQVSAGSTPGPFTSVIVCELVLVRP